MEKIKNSIEDYLDGIYHILPNDRYAYSRRIWKNFCAGF